MPTATKTFEKTEKQRSAISILASDAIHVMLYGGSRCVAGDTVLDGHTESISALAERGDPVEVITSHGTQMADAPFLKGTAALLEITTADGRSVKVTPDHRFWNGRRWVRAETMTVGACVAVRLSEQNLQMSNSEPFQLENDGDGLRSTERARGYPGSCSLCLRQRDGLPQTGLAFSLAFCALQSYGLARIRVRRLFSKLGLNIRKDRQLRHGKVHSLVCQMLCRPSSMDGSPSTNPACGSLDHAFLQTYVSSLGQHRKKQKARLRSFLSRLTSAVSRNSCYQSCLISDETPKDTPYRS